MRIPSGVTDQYIYFVAVDSTDFTTRETGLSSFTVYRSRNGAAAAAMTTPTVNETDTTNMPGVYELLLDEDMTIGSGNDSEEMVFHITATGMAPVTRTIELYRPKITAGNTLGVAADGDVSGNVDGAVASVTAGVSLAAGAITNASLAGNMEIVFETDFATNYNATRNAWATNVQDFVGTSAADPFNGQVVAASVTAGVTASTVSDKTGYSLSAAGVDAIWDEATSGHVTAGTYGVAITDILTDTADIQPNYATSASISALNDIAAADVWAVDATTQQTQGTFGQAIGDPGADTTTIYQAVATDAAGDNVSIDVAAVKAQTAAIETDTQDLQTQVGTAGAGLTNLGGSGNNWNVGKTGYTLTATTGLGDQTANITGNLSGSVGSNLELGPAEVNAEVVDALNTDTYAEPGQGTPGATISLAAKIGYLYKAWRNRSTQDATTYSLYNDDTTTVDQKATVSDNGTTADKGEVATGP